MYVRSQIFLGAAHQNGEIYTKLPQNIPNGHKIYQHLTLQALSELTKIGIFGFKIYHLATLVRR
jgi:hypothetical protein